MIGFLLIFTLQAGIATVLLMPAWFISRLRPEPESRLLLSTPAISIAAWLCLLSANFGGSASLANLVEGFLVGGIAVVLAYGKVLVVDRWIPNQVKSTYGLVTASLVAAVLVRWLMPDLPE